MLLRSVSRDWVVCPGCGEKHGECADWVKSMPHREICSCGAEMVCWFETEITYHAEILGDRVQKMKKKKKDEKAKMGRKTRKKSKKR
jgi:hypothetical protein